MQHRAQIDAARTSDGKYDYSPCFSLIKEEISRADIAIGNLEVTLGGKPYQAILLSVHPTNICKLSKMPDSTFFSQQTIIAWIEARPDWNGPSHKSNHFPYPMQVLTGTLQNVNNSILSSSGKKVSAQPYSTTLTALMESRYLHPTSSITLTKNNSKRHTQRPSRTPGCYYSLYALGRRISITSEP